MAKSAEEHARDWDLRHEDFNDHDLLYEVYAVMRERAPIVHTATPFFPTDGAWVALGYDECYQIAQDWQHFSSNPTPEGAQQAGGDLVITLDPPRQQSFRKVLNPYFSSARMKALTPQIRAETDLLLDTFIEQGSGDLAQIAWQQPGIVFFKYLLGMPVDDVPLCLELVDTALNGHSEQDRAQAWGGLYQHVHDAVSARATAPPRDDMIDVLLHAEIDGEPLPFNDIVANAILLVQAGLETTASAMSFAFHYLAGHPAERDRLIAEPEILPRAVEEFIRSPARSTACPAPWPRTSSWAGTRSVRATRSWSTTPRPTATRRGSRIRIGVCWTVRPTVISASGRVCTGASAPTWPASSSPWDSSRCWPGCPTSCWIRPAPQCSTATP